MNTVILIQLLLAHFLTDFVFQPKSWVAAKLEKGLRSKFFWYHILIAGLTTYLILHQWDNWKIPLFILATHAVIDYWKIYTEEKQVDNNKPEGQKQKTITKLFFIDQFFHLISIIAAWLWVIDGFGLVLPFMEGLISNKKPVAILSAVIFLIWPLGVIIGKITDPFRVQINSKDSLENAGKYIGFTERILVFIFILVNQYAAIGFLIAAKSILRISTEKNRDARKQSEYILIGTLISFTSAIIIGLSVQYVIGL